MNNNQIDKLIKSSSYLGSFAYDEIPEIPTTDFSLVINTEPATQPGEHWVALVKKLATFYFFDSYGRQLSDMTLDAGFVATIKKITNGSKVVFNKQWLQQVMSNVCGEYCIYLINSLVDHDFKYVLSNFSDNLKANDVSMIKYTRGL